MSAKHRIVDNDDNDEEENGNMLAKCHLNYGKMKSNRKSNWEPKNIY